MNLDFLIFYEHASRELESDCYLAALLRMRGYKVKIINRRYLWRVFLNPKVIITPFLYGGKDVREFTGFINGRKRAIINLQYEQVLSDEDLTTDFFKLSENSINAVHICWGANTQRRHLLRGLKESQLPITGFISMDFNNPKLRSLLKGKKELADEFKLAPEKKWHLFISSFVISSLSESETAALKDKLPGYDDFFDLQPASQEGVIDWIKEMALQHPEQEFIYRPHPAEHATRQILKLESFANNIHVIPDYSIRQWVNICETCSTWYSTSIVDAYFANHPCCILRPVPIPDRFEVNVMKSADILTSVTEYDEFLSKEYVEKDKITPLNQEVLSDYYLTDTSKLFGENLADVCVKVLNGNYYLYKRSWKDCLIAFKYDCIASVFRLFPFLGGNPKSRFYDFNRLAIASKNDKILLNNYMDRFYKYLMNGK